MFRPLRNVLRYLGASGRVRLESPELQTAGSGLHLVRLRVVEPDTAFPLPTIRYLVMEEAGPGQPRAPEPLQLRGPGHLASLGDHTRFVWDLVEGASAYQVEIYAKPDPKGAKQPDEVLQPPVPAIAPASVPLPGRLVTGSIVGADERQVELSAAQRSRLEPGQRYLWRVRAVAADGIVVGESPVREFSVPLRQ
jgi:hypothetical protein